jgi:hypothetical protein
MLLTRERLYFDLGRLIADMPELDRGEVTADMRRWLASAHALVRSSGSLADALQLAVACENLEGPLRSRNAETITGILQRVLARAERGAEGGMRGSVLLIGGDRDAYAVVREVLATAASDVLLVEPAAAARILADYAVLAPERVRVRLLADAGQYKPSLLAGAQRWRQRFGSRRYLELRLASAHSLHERLLQLDRGRAWVLGVPFSELARRTHTTLVRMRPEEEARKIAVYSEIWEEAEPLSARSYGLQP